MGSVVWPKVRGDVVLSLLMSGDPGHVALVSRWLDRCGFADVAAARVLCEQDRLVVDDGMAMDLLSGVVGLHRFTVAGWLKRAGLIDDLEDLLRRVVAVGWGRLDAWRERRRAWAMRFETLSGGVGVWADQGDPAGWGLVGWFGEIARVEFFEWRRGPEVAKAGVIRRSGVSRFVDWDPNSPEVEHVLADDVMIGDDEERKQSTSGLVLAALEATGIDVHAKPHQLERLLKGLNQGRGEGVWELLRSALEKMYEQAAAGEAVEVPPVWVRALAGEV